MTVKLALPRSPPGVKKTVRLKTPGALHHCDGSGAKPGTKPTTCTTCGGSGEVRRAARSMFGQFVSVSPCPTCAGEGSVVARAVRGLPRRGPGAGRAHGDGGDPGRRLRQQLSDAARAGRGRAAQRPARRSARDARHQGGRAVRAPGRRPDLRPPALVLPGGARRGGHRAHAVRRGRGPRSRRAPSRRRCSGYAAAGCRCWARARKGDLLVRVHVWTPERLTAEQERLFRELAKLEGEPPKRSPGFWSKLKEALGA